MRTCLLVLTILVGCKKPIEVTPSTAPAAETPETAPEVTAPDLNSPEGLYASCLDRVENPQEGGECEQDTDCAVGGASGEVCTTSAAAADLMTSAERRRCFTVLDACGCREGACTWSIQDTVPQDAPALPSKPATLPPTGGPPPEGR